MTLFGVKLNYCYLLRITPLGVINVVRSNRHILSQLQLRDFSVRKSEKVTNIIYHI